MTDEKTWWDNSIVSIAAWLKRFVCRKTDNLYMQLLRYTFVGGVAFVVDYLLLYVLTEWVGLYYLYSALLSFVAGLLVNYVLSKIWVFNKSAIKHQWLEFAVFAFIGVIGLMLTEILMWWLTSKMGLFYMFSKIVTTMIVYLWNFFARKYIIFK